MAILRAWEALFGRGRRANATKVISERVIRLELEGEQFKRLEGIPTFNWRHSLKVYTQRARQ